MHSSIGHFFADIFMDFFEPYLSDSMILVFGNYMQDSFTCYMRLEMERMEREQTYR